MNVINSEVRPCRIEIATPRAPSFRASELEYPGLGGNESTCVLWSRELARRGHDVAVYVPGIEVEYQGGVAWYPLDQWGTRHSDIAISMRDPGPLACLPETTVRILFLGDRHTEGIASLRPGRDVDLLWFNSQHQIKLHQAAFCDRIPIVSGCCGFDESLFHPIPKKLNSPLRFLHSSVPYRGLGRLLKIWPLIHQALPDSELHVTGGYTLWGYTPHEADGLMRQDIDAALLTQPGIVYHGALTRSAYVEVVRHSDILLYPTNYEETCCIAVLEACASGVVPIVSAVGALTERVRDQVTGILVDPAADLGTFAETVIDLARNTIRLASFSAEAVTCAEEYSIRKMVDLLEQAIESCRTH